MKTARLGSIVLCILLGAELGIGSDVFAQKKKSKTSDEKPKKSIQVEKPVPFIPTFFRGEGSVARYFFPTDSGAEWTMMTVTTHYSDTGSVITTDTAYSLQRVINSKGFSLQNLPIVHCKTLGWRKGMTDSVEGKAMYYVDDSIAMTVVNNSVTNILNRIFLVAPLKVGNAWHEKYDDSVYCVIVSVSDTLETSMGVFDSVLVTVTRAGYAEITKFYASDHGLIRSVFRAPGPGSRGIIVVATEMIAIVSGQNTRNSEVKEILSDK